MRLADVAKYFDKTLCADAFTPATQFYGQLDVFDDSKRDGATVVRRVLSVASDVSIPARRVLTIDSQPWIVGQNEDDFWAGEVLRRKYVLQRADGAASIRTVAESIAGAGGTATYAAKLWVKDQKEVEQSSSMTGFFNVYLPTYESVDKGSIIVLSSRLHLVRNTFVSAGGFLVCESDELEADAVAAATYKGHSAYDPATDTYTEGSVAVTVLRARWQADFDYTSEASPKFVRGDELVYVRASEVAAPAAQDKVTVDGVTYVVLAVRAEGTSWALHLRRAAS